MKKQLVIPAKVRQRRIRPMADRIQVVNFLLKKIVKAWIPAFAGMTVLSGTAFAMAQRPADPSAPPPPGWVQLVPFAVMFVVFYFLLIRPQLRQKKEKDNMVNSLKKGDRVVTQGGFIVTIMNINPTTMDVKLNDETKVKILRSAVIEVFNEQNQNTEVKEPVPSGK